LLTGGNIGDNDCDIRVKQFEHDLEAMCVSNDTAGIIAFNLFIQIQHNIKGEQNM
jgi:hypothetical protein